MEYVETIVSQKFKAEVLKAWTYRVFILLPVVGKYLGMFGVSLTLNVRLTISRCIINASCLQVPTLLSEKSSLFSRSFFSSCLCSRQWALMWTF